MREIQFPESINGLQFIDNKGNLMVGHGHTLSLISAQQILQGIPKIIGKTSAELQELYQPVNNELLYTLYMNELDLKNQIMEA